MALVDTVEHAWEFCSYNRGTRGACGCFYCERTFDATEIIRWVDSGQTALCPKCGIDSVLPGDKVRIDPEFLRTMNERFFERTVLVTVSER